MKIVKGDIVYWCSRTGHKFSVHWGRVDEQYFGEARIDYLAVKERRLIDGVPIDEFKSEDKFKKLPKGWGPDTKLFEITLAPIENRFMNIRNPKVIKRLYSEGLLVKRGTIFPGTVEAEITRDGYRLVKKYNSYLPRRIDSTTVPISQLYKRYAGAKLEVIRNREEFIRQSELTPLEWSIEQIDKDLNRWQQLNGETEIEKEALRVRLLELERVEDIETRLWGSSIQWKYWKNKRWNNIEY